MAKKKGWLDKYKEGGIESTQAGYTDVPFDYNSAWGGQFEDGGEIPQAQPGISFLPQEDPEMIYEDRFNTPLNKKEQKEFAQWAAKESKRRGRNILMDKGAYDVQGFWKSGDYKKMDSDNHGTDTWKKPNHPTFSNQSKYHGVDGFYGGNWNPDGGYQPSKQTADMYGPSYYNWLFSREPNRPEHLDASRFTSEANKPSPLYFAMGGTLPGSTGFMYARTNSPAPSEGPYAKKTMPSAQEGEIVPQTDAEVEQARQSMVDFYANRPANLSGDIASGAVKNVNIEQVPIGELQKLQAYGAYYPTTDTIGYSDETRTLIPEDPYDKLQMLEHEIGHSVYNKLPNKEKNIIKKSIVTPREFRKRFNKEDVDMGWARYVTTPTEFYTRRNRMFDVFEIDPSQPITDEKAQEMIDFRKWTGSSTSPEEKAELLKKHPNFNKYLENYEGSENKPEIIDFMNSIKNDVPTYKRVFNEVTAVPGEQAPIAQNGMSYYQHGLDWKPKSISKKGGVIKDDRGQWDHPGEITEISSNNITMQGVPYPVLGIGGDGQQIMMQPGEDYKFNEGPVTEIPMAQKGKKVLSPVYVSDPNDPRLRAYNDSSAAYDYGQTQKAQFLKTHKDAKNQGTIIKPSSNPNKKYPFINSKGKNTGNLSINSYSEEFTPPDRTLSEILFGSNKTSYLGSNTYNEWQKPVQPVIYQEEPKSSPKQIFIQPSKPELPTLKRKVSKMEPISTKQSSSPSLRTIDVPNIELPPVKSGNYMVGYIDENNKGVDRGFATPEQRDAFVKELEQRNLSSVQPYRGNITQYYNITKKVNKKSTGGWLDQYK